MLQRRALGALLFVLAASPSLPAATVSTVFSGRIPCATRDGVQFCGGTLATRVESFDGVPLDVAVTLPPASMDGPFPLIVDLHGWSLGKSGGPYVAWAQAGYAVLSYTARGFHNSCGSAAARMPDPTLSDPNVCASADGSIWPTRATRGTTRSTWPACSPTRASSSPPRSASPARRTVAGRPMILAALKDRVMQLDGTLVPWKSPGGLDMAIAAGAALIPWSDLAYSLTPNGRTLDYRSENPYGPRGGVQKQSWNAALYAVGGSSGYYAPPGVDFGADIQSWNVRIGQGEPYDGDSAVGAILTEITSHHSAYYVDDSTAPAPLFIYSAWTDDLFPADEALRFWRKTVAKHPGAELALHFADDFGHSRASLGFGGAKAFQRATAFFGRHLQGTGDPLPVVETYTQACHGATLEGPFTAGDWDALHPGEVRYKSRRPQRFTGAPSNADTANVTDPLNITGPCRTAPATDDPTAATYRLPAATGEGYTLLGSPTIVADLAVTGANAQVVARLWDVATDGMQTLVAQAVYRPRTDNRGPQVFQLHPNAWRFADGHVPKLELVGQSAAYMRPSNGTFGVTVSELELRLPVREAPSAEAHPRTRGAACCRRPMPSRSAARSRRAPTAAHPFATRPCRWPSVRTRTGPPRSSRGGCAASKATSWPTWAIRSTARASCSASTMTSTP